MVMRRRFALVSTTIFILVILTLIIISTLISTHHSSPKSHPLHSLTSSGNRKLQVYGKSFNRISRTLFVTWIVVFNRLYPKRRSLILSGTCTNRDISISQTQDTNTGGIPRYIVQIVNTCVSGCAPSHIHLHCGWFASARLVNPTTFKRLAFDDCFVNAGQPLKTGQIIRFTYLNSFMYPLSFKSATFC